MHLHLCDSNNNLKFNNLSISNSFIYQLMHNRDDLKEY